MRWTTNETYQFVMIYLKQEIMWNPKHRDHKRKADRKETMLGICAEFTNKTGISISESEAYLKVRTLQSTYSQEVAKIKQRSSSGWAYRPRIRWFNEWHRCYVKRMKAIKNEPFLTHNSIDETKEEQQDKLAEKDTFINSEYDNHEDSPEEYSHAEYKTSFKEELEDSKETLLQDPKKVKKQRLSPHPLPDRLLMGFATSSLGTISKEDEFDIYGKFIASQLRKMDLNKALRVQLQIQTVVSEARITN